MEAKQTKPTPRKKMINIWVTPDTLRWLESKKVPGKVSMGDNVDKLVKPKTRRARIERNAAK